MIFDTKNIYVREFIYQWNSGNYEGDYLPVDLFYECREFFPNSTGSFFDWKEAEKARNWTLGQISKKRRVLISNDGSDAFDLYSAPEPTFSFMEWVLNFFNWSFEEVSREEALSWVND